MALESEEVNKGQNNGVLGVRGKKFRHFCLINRG